jgi:hypothetical protein
MMPAADEDSTMTRFIIIALAALAAHSMAAAPLGAEDLHTDGSSSSQNAPKTMDRASFAVAVYLNDNASTCTSQPFKGARQRIVDIALGEWERFGHQSIDVSKLPVQPVPGFSPPLAPTPGSEEKWPLLLRIAGFWAAVGADWGKTYAGRQNSRWKTNPRLEWQDHWSAAFTSWVMCEVGLNDVQFARSVKHADYIKSAMKDSKSSFDLMPAGSLPKPGDLLCATEAGSNPGNKGFDRGNPKSLDGLRLLHCYVVVASDKAATYVVGGNVIDWSETPAREFGSVGLLIVDNGSIAARGPAAPCANNRPCWLLGLALKTEEAAAYETSPLSDKGRAMFTGANAAGPRQ